jgi:hypothetical protein
MLDGNISIVDLSCPQGSYILFAAIGVWEYFGHITAAQKVWKKALRWLDRLPSSVLAHSSIGNCVRAVLDSTSWAKSLNKLSNSMQMTDMANFLSNRYLSDDHIDAMIDCLGAYLAVSSQAGSVLLMLNHFSYALSNIPRLPSKPMGEGSGSSYSQATNKHLTDVAYYLIRDNHAE